MSRLLFIAVVMAVTLVATLPEADAATWKAGAAKVKITPKEFMWMSGYGGRNKPAEGKLTELWAAALVLEDPEGNRVALVTLDLVGIDRAMSVAIRRDLESKYGLTTRQVAICCSHTHTGPVVGTNLKTMYALSDRQWKQVESYTETVKRQVVEVVGQAVKELAPAEISWGVGQATFATNRRTNREAEVPKLREEGKLQGPFDHDVPVLKVAGPDGKARAIVFGYACHATVLSFYQWSGDYPGFAQIEIEKAHPGAVALFWAGCGGDQNPLPRRQVELAQEYGRRLAAAVGKVTAGEMRPISGTLATAYKEIDLGFAALPSREEIEANAKSANRFEAGRAKVLLERIAADGKLRTTYPYPIQVWRLGDGPRWITLGGEVVVDYSLRLKSELGGDADANRGRVWVAGYANDVMAYIPSRRVLREGGYEGGTSMVYYGLPTVWSPDVERDIVRTVLELARTLNTKPSR